MVSCCLSFAPSRTSLNLDKVLCARASADGSVRLWGISTHLYSNINTNSNTNDDHKDDKDGESESNRKSKRNVILPAVATVSTHSSGIHDLVWSPRTPNLIATASNDKTLQIWDVTRAPACSPLANSNSYRRTTKSWYRQCRCRFTSSQRRHSTRRYIISDAVVEFKGKANFCFLVNFNAQGNLLVMIRSTSHSWLSSHH